MKKQHYHLTTEKYYQINTLHPVGSTSEIVSQTELDAHLEVIAQASQVKPAYVERQENYIITRIWSGDGKRFIKRIFQNIVHI